MYIGMKNLSEYIRMSLPMFFGIDMTEHAGKLLYAGIPKYVGKGGSISHYMQMLRYTQHDTHEEGR